MRALGDALRLGYQKMSYWEAQDPMKFFEEGLRAVCGIFTTNCSGCGKQMFFSNEEFLGCHLYCDDCPFPEDPCETCGKPDCDGSCCNCSYCLIRKAALK